MIGGINLKKWIIILVVILILTLTACFSEGTPDDSEGPEDPKQRPEGDHIASIGYEGFEEEIVFQTYEIDWLRILYDTSLEMRLRNNEVSFSREEDEAELRINLLGNPDFESEMHSRIRRDGYNLITEFQLIDHQGKGYIYYSREDRHTVELYVIEERGKKVVVQFFLPEREFDQYIHSFEYMLESIEIL